MRLMGLRYKMMYSLGSAEREAPVYYWLQSSSFKINVSLESSPSESSSTTVTIRVDSLIRSSFIVSSRRRRRKN
jgi:hypothetical protein